MADKKVKVQVDVEGNVVESIANLRALKQSLKEVPAGTSEWSKIKNQIRDVEDSLESAKQSSEDFKGMLENAPGPLGALGGAIKKVELATKSWGAALKATGIGLIVSTIGLLVGAFAKTEGSMKKLEPLFIMFEKLLGGLVEAFTPLIEGFANLAIKVLPVLIDGIKKYYAGLVAFFTLIKEVGTGAAKILKGIFTFDVKSAQEGLEQIQGSWDKTKASFNEFTDNFEKGYAKQTETQKKNAKDAQDIAAKNEELRKKRLAEALKDLEFSEKLSESELEKQKEVALGLAQTEQEKLDIETTYAKKRYDLQKKQLEDRLKLLDPKKDKEEYRATLLALSDLDKNRIKELNGFKDQQKKITDDQLKAAKDFAEKSKQIKNQAIKDEVEKAIADRQAKYEKDLADLEADKEFIKKSETEKADLRKSLQTALNNDIAKIKDDAATKALNDDLVILEAQQKTLIEGTQAYLANSIAIENAAYELKRKNAKDNAKQLQAIEIEHEQNLKDIKLKAAIAEKQIQLDRLNVIAGIGNSLAQLAGKNKALAIAAIAVEKAAAIGSIIVNTQIANLKAVAASPLTFGMPWVAVNNVAGALAVAATVAAGVKAVQDLNAISIPGASGAGGSAGGGGGAAASMPSYGGAGTSMSAPQIQTNSAINPSTQIAQTIGASREPVKAYVVSGEITSQQALDRRTNRAATFAG